MKREDVSTLFICSYLRALNRQLTFEIILWMCKFENIFKIPKFGKLYNDSHIVENAYKVFVLKIFQRKKCLCGKMFFGEQAITSYLPTQKSFVLFSSSFR